MVQRGILRNSFWYGLETAADILFGAVASVLIARVFGPEKMGYFVYLTFLTNVAGKLGGLGMATAAKKYIAEYFNKNELGMVRAVFFEALKTQTLLAVLISVIGLGMVLKFGDPSYQLMSTLLVLAVGPVLVGAVPALTNIAAEDFSRNVPGALFGLLTYMVTVTLTLVLDWGVVGLAAAVFLRRFIEMSVRLWNAIRWMRRLPKIEAPAGFRKMLFTFSGQALGITVLMLVVWDRSELLFLKQFSSITQLAFYTVAFGLTEQILTLPNVFSGSVGAALMAEHARSADRAGLRASNALRFLFTLVLPIHIGLAALSAPLVKLTYGDAYIAAIPVLAVAVILGITKAFFWMPWSIYQAADRQGTLFRWLAAAAAVNLILDTALIPQFHAIGAAIANGVSQSLAVIAIWPTACRLCNLKFPWASLRRTALSAGAMGLVVSAIAALMSPLAATMVGIPTGIIVYTLLIRQSRILNQEDVQFVFDRTRRLPRPVRRIVDRISTWAAAPSVSQPETVSSTCGD